MQILQIHSITRMASVIVFEISSRSLDYPWCIELRDGSKYYLSPSKYNCSSLITRTENKTKKFPFLKHNSFDFSKMLNNVNFYDAKSDFSFVIEKISFKKTIGFKLHLRPSKKHGFSDASAICLGPPLVFY